MIWPRVDNAQSYAHENVDSPLPAPGGAGRRPVAGLPVRRPCGRMVQPDPFGKRREPAGTPVENVEKRIAVLERHIRDSTAVGGKLRADRDRIVLRDLREILAIVIRYINLFVAGPPRAEDDLRRADPTYAGKMANDLVGEIMAEVPPGLRLDVQHLSDHLGGDRKSVV